MIAIEDRQMMPKDIAISELENELYFDYKISRTITFTRTDEPGCEICGNDVVASYIAPFLSSKAPLNKVQKLLFLKFKLTIDESVLIKHREHINCVYNTDDELKQLGITDLELIESEIPDQINEDNIIEAQIRQLQALGLRYRKEGDITGVIRCSSLLIKWVELKKKLKSEINTGTQNYKVADIINLGGVEDKKEEKHGRRPIDITPTRRD